MSNAVELLGFVEARIEDTKAEARRRGMSYAGLEIEEFWRDVPNIDGGWASTRVVSPAALAFAGRFDDHPDYREEWKP